MKLVRHVLVSTIATALLVACGTVRGSVITVAPGNDDIQPTLYVILPFERQRETPSGLLVSVQNTGLTDVEAIFRSRIKNVLPSVVDHRSTQRILDETGVRNLSRITPGERRRVAARLDADAIVTGVITHYHNPYAVAVTVTATHARTGAPLWSGEVTVRRGMNDYANTGAKAVDVLVTELDDQLNG